MAIRDNTASSRILDIVIYAVLIIMAMIIMYPILNLISISLSSYQAVSSGSVTFYPKDISFNAYKTIFQAGKIPRGFINSIYYTAAGTLINMLLTCTMAYPLSRKNLLFRKFYTALVLIPMFFNGGLIPTFLLVKNLGLYNTTLAMLLPNAIVINNLIIMRTFFQSIPVDLEEAAYLDGANEVTIFLKIILPLSTAAIATISLFYAVGHWNSWFDALVYLKDAKRYPLQYLIRQIIMENQMNEELAAAGSFDDNFNLVTSDAIKYATLVVSMVPMMLLYPFVQKYFVQGIMVGSLKG